MDEVVREQNRQHPRWTNQLQSMNEIEMDREREEFKKGSQRYAHHSPKRNDGEDSIEDSSATSIDFS